MDTSLIVIIGGFLGPVISGLLRNEFGWPAVFKASALWIALHFAVLFLFHREPEDGHEHDRPSSAGATTGWLACLAVLIVSFGEMTASPKTFESVSTVAPKDRSALYMGYTFVSTALSSLFAGLLSGPAYGKLARDPAAGGAGSRRRGIE